MKDNEMISGTESMQGARAEGRGGHGGVCGGSETLSGGWTEGGNGQVVLGGRYRVVRRLGEGGMGSVWLAEDSMLDGRKVAIKMLPAVLAGKKGACRQVKQEALVAMKLSHPNIATVRAFEEEEGGAPFLVMDYIDGVTLEEILAEKGPLGEEETLRLLGPVAAALDYAHGKGVVHRDVKPENVMVAKDGTPYVLDFGIAREIQETMTRMTGKLSSGTLLYMSPEQLRGWTPQAEQDVYSFAAMAYECLTGAPPFSRGQVEWQIMHEPAEPLAEKAAGNALREGVMAGLSKEPGGRPGSCAGVLGAVESRGNGRGGHGMGRKGNAASTGGRAVAWVWLPAVALLAAAVAAGVWWGAARKAVEGAGETVVQEAPAVPETERGKDAGEMPMVPVETRQDAETPDSVPPEEGVVVPSEEEVVVPPNEEKVEGAPEAGRQEKTAGETKTIALPQGVELEMVWCPEIGEGIWMGKYEVTQAQWESVMGRNPAHCKGSDLPVESVSWYDCMEFVDNLNQLPGIHSGGLVFRLPTDAEWTVACRAGMPEEEDFHNLADGTPVTRENLDRVAWSGEEWDTGSTHPVGQKEPNAWGLHDMFGNVWEWTQTTVGNKCASHGGGAFNPSGNNGGWGSVNWERPGHACRNHGFRLAADERPEGK